MIASMGPTQRAEPLPTARANDLVRAGQCSASCLVADSRDAQTCDCRCGSKFHGALADIDIATDRDVRPWWVRCANGGWSESELRDAIPEVRDIPAGNRLWQKQQDKRGPYSITRRTARGSWLFELDLATLGLSDRQLDRTWARNEAALAVDELLSQLLSIGRITTYYGPPSSYVWASGLQNDHEARVIAALVIDTFQGCSDGLQNAVSVLEGAR